ncbi:MAG TPA: STAS domain-containing protein [Solirubrobacteraceae bacterium]|jgi:ABC-type transporter Mla MlaB component
MSENTTPTGSPPRIATLTIDAPLARADLPGLLARSCALLDGGAVEVLRCEVAGVSADVVAVDALARLALLARRRGCRIRLAGVSAELTGLIALAGLADVLHG